MIESLKFLPGRRKRLGGACAAPLDGTHLVLVSPRKPDVGQVRASGDFGGFAVSIRELSLDNAESKMQTAQLSDLLERLVPQLDGEARAELLNFFRLALLPKLDGAGALALAQSLHLIRERLIEPTPHLPVDGPERFVIELVLGIDERAFVVAGWCSEGEEMLTRIALITPEGQPAGTLEGAYRYLRPDVEEHLAASGLPRTEKHGYMKYLELDEPSLLSQGWMAQVRSLSSMFRVSAPVVNRDPAVARERLLAEAARDPLDAEQLRRMHVHPALTHLQAHIRKSIEIESTVQHGRPPVSPDVSIIVPLYGRIDLLEHQMAQLWHDPEIRDAEVIYVLDSPELGPPLTRFAAELHALYGLPFRIIRLNRNAGYATANNLAVSQANGRLVVLLNSDVLPAGHGWLGRMKDFYDATPDIGALGPKLLFEDGSIQHAGMYFRRDPVTRWWENQHYHKGLSGLLPEANVTRPVPAVTGACLMIARDLYVKLGGLRDMFVKGGYEDSDLCLRVIEAGYENWYLADVELYHLEAQSFPIHERFSNKYNAWLQTYLWSDHIPDLMRRHSEVADRDRVPAG